MHQTKTHEMPLVGFLIFLFKMARSDHQAHYRVKRWGAARNHPLGQAAPGSTIRLIIKAILKSFHDFGDTHILFAKQRTKQWQFWEHCYIIVL